MKSVHELLSLSMIKLSNQMHSKNYKKISVSFTMSLILLSLISLADLVHAQTIFQEPVLNQSGDISNSYYGPDSSKILCNDPIEVKGVSSSSSSEDGDNIMSAGSAIDKDASTEWSTDKVGEYIQLDLGTTRSVCEIKILWNDGDERSYNFIVSVSENGTVFKNVMRAISSGNSSFPESYHFPDTKAKLVRLTMYGNSEDESASMKELSLNGRDIRKVGDKYVVCGPQAIVDLSAGPSQSGDPPDKAVDGDSTTAWSSLGVGSFIQSDLGSLRTVCGVNIAWYDGEAKQYKFEISVSKDGINFNQVYGGTSSGNSIRPELYTLPDVNARYVKITVFGNDKNNWAGITGLSIQGFVPPPPPNRPPTADSKHVSTDMNAPINIKLSGLDPEGSLPTFTVVDLPKHGQLSSVLRDVVKYVPDKDFAGSDSFTYTVKDNRGMASSKATVTTNVKEVLQCRLLSPMMITAIGSDANIPSNVIDDNLNTRWSKDGIGSWIQFDLGSRTKICSVDIAWYRGDMRQNNFAVSISNDSSTFRNIFTGKGSGTTTGFEKYNLPTDSEGRYVRITVDRNTENNWASVAEIAIFGSSNDMAPQSPPPPPPSAPQSPPNPSEIGDANQPERWYQKDLQYKAWW
jgi:hypothetical protein